MAGYSILGDNSLYTSGWDNGLTPPTNFNSGYSNIVNNGGWGNVASAFGSNNGVQAPVFNYNNVLSAFGKGLNKGLLNANGNVMADPLTKTFSSTGGTNGIGATGSGFLKKVADTTGKNTGFLGSQGYTNILNSIGLGLQGLYGIGSYLNGRKQLAMAKEAMRQQQANFNESFNAAFKEMNTRDARRIAAAAQFEKGDSHAYDDEIAANAYERGHTSPADSSYLTFKRSANA